MNRELGGTNAGLASQLSCEIARSVARRCRNRFVRLRTPQALASLTLDERLRSWQHTSIMDDPVFIGWWVMVSFLVITVVFLKAFQSSF